MNDRPCERCGWLADIGYLVFTVGAFAEVDPIGKVYSLYGEATRLKGLDAVAGLLIEHATTHRTHVRDVNQIVRDGQRGADEAYDAGMENARRLEERP